MDQMDRIIQMDWMDQLDQFDGSNINTNSYHIAFDQLAHPPACGAYFYHIHYPATCEVVPGALVWSTQAGASKNDPLGPVPAKPAGKWPTRFLGLFFSDITVD